MKDWQDLQKERTVNKNAQSRQKSPKLVTKDPGIVDYAVMGGRKTFGVR